MFSLKDIVYSIKVQLQQTTLRNTVTQVQTALKTAFNTGGAQQGVTALNSSITSLSKNIKQAGTLFMTYFGGRTIVRFLQESIMMFAQFDQKIQQSVAIMDNVSKAMRDKMGKTAIEISKQLNISAVEVAEGYFHLAQAGYNAEQSLAALPIVATFAKAGMFDLAKGTEQLSQVLSALGYDVENADDRMANLARVGDVIALGAARSQASIEQLAESLRNKAGNSLRLFNKDVEEGVAVLARMADQGTKGAVAGERLDMFLRQATQAAITHKEAFKRFGIQIFDTAGNVRNLADIADDLTKALGGLNDESQVTAMQQLGFQVRSQFVVKAFIDQGDAIRDYEKQMRNASGFMEKVAQKQLLTPIEQWGLFKRKVEAVRIEIGEQFIPSLIRLGEKMGDEDDPSSIVGQLHAFAQHLKDNPEQIDAIAESINALISTLGALWDILNLVADLFVVGVNVPLFILGGLLAFVNLSLGYMVKGLGTVVSMANGPFGEAIKKIGNELIVAGQAAGDFANGRLENIELTAKDFMSRQLGFGPRVPPTKKPPRTPIPHGKGGTGVPGTDTIPDSPVDVEDAERLQNKLDEMMARHVAGRLDNEMEAIDQLEAEYNKLYKGKIPKIVQESLAQMRTQTFSEEHVKKLADRFDKQFKLALAGFNDDPSTLAANKAALDEFINITMPAEINALEDGSVAREEANKLLEKAIELRERLNGKIKENADKEKEEADRKTAQVEEARMRKIERIGKHAAESMAAAFGVFYDTLVDGSGRGVDAFENMGRAIVASLGGALAEYAMNKSRENFIHAAEETAKGIAAISDPFLAWSAGGHFSAAARFAAVGTAWAALAGGAGAASSSFASHGHGMPGQQQDHSRNTDNIEVQPVINIYVDGVDPNNPRHQRLIGQTINEYTERTGGNARINRRTM